MTVTSGRNIAELLTNANPVGCLLKMCLASAQPYSTRCYLTWKVWTTPQGRLLFRLAPSTPRTGETEFSLLPTLTDPSKGGGSSRSGDRINETPSLQGMARKGLLPTLTVTDSGTGRFNKSASPNAANRPTLAMAARMGLLPTLKSRDYRTGSHLDSDKMQKKSNGTWHSPDLNDVLAPGGQLNPTWCEWLIGFPPGWTDLEHSAMP